MALPSVELGFVEKRASWKLRSKFFPSKVGGIPAWLRLNNLPSTSDLKCKTCGKPFVFLLQVYAPILEVKDSFHRTLFIFMCSHNSCNKKSDNSNFVVFRSQLPRKNEFYSFEPPIENEKSALTPSAENYQTMCDICGYQALLACDKCSLRNYCSEEHRNCDWKWSHQDFCGKENGEISRKSKKSRNPFLLSEFELVTETEDLPPETPEKSEMEKMREYHEFMKSDKAPKECQDVPLEDVDAFIKKKDKAFTKFQKKIKHEPEQVLRYQRGGTPLWVSSEHIPSDADIPPCGCGAKRIFEFQVMPQLLNYLELDAVTDSVDWGTLIVYTCSQSCKEGRDAYAKEFLWKQDFSDDKEN